MSKITPVYRGVMEKLAEIFPQKSLIPDPYDLKNNVDNLLTEGYGLKVGGDNPVTTDWCSFSNARTFTVVFTREMVATASNPDIPNDTSLLLLEDIYESRHLMNSPDRLGITQIDNVELGGSTPVTEVFVGKRKFLSMECDFNITISENY